MSTSNEKPFRDELAAAHARIAQLEKELHEIQAVAQPYLKRTHRRVDLMILLALLCLAAIAVGFIAGAASKQGSERQRKLESESAAASASTARSGPMAAGPPTAPSLDRQTHAE